MMFKLTVDEVKKIINSLVKTLNMKYVETMPTNPMVAYEPNEHCGVTGVGIITTSHIIIHTWDYTKYFQADVYSCKNFDEKEVVELIKSNGLIPKYQRLLDRNGEIKDLTY